MSKPSYNNNQQQPHRPTRFFLIVSLFVIAMSILAVYSTIIAIEYGLKKDDMHTHAIDTCLNLMIGVMTMKSKG